MSSFPIQSADLGLQADAAAGNDSGTFSLIALFKRLLGFVNPSAVYTDLSTVVPADGASHQLVAANAAGNGLMVINLGSDTIWLNINGTATAGPGSVPITQYGSFDTGKQIKLTQSVQLLVPTGGLYTAKSY